MKIDFDFSNEQCAIILRKMGYTTEMVRLYYNPDTDPYENETETSELRGMDCKVVYQAGHKPEALEKEKPLVSECMNYMYDKAVNRIFSNWFYNILLQHNPNTQSHI